MNPGDILDGRYQITSRLGAGGMGEVYKATHTLLGAARVIKVVHPQIAGNSDAKDRFFREARIATKVQHQNVAAMHDFAALPDGSHYMVWEFIDGENLAQRLRARGTLPPRQAVKIAIQALHGLEAIHRAGIVHRDISPENLMITGDDAVKIIDLGVAKFDDPDAVSQTRTGMFVGKLRYSAPEQLGFIPEGEKIDGRTDLYAMAMVIVELLTGRPPYEAKSPHEYFLHHAREVNQTLVTLPPTLPGSAALQAVLEKALARDRNARFTTAREFAEALEAIERTLPAEDDVRTAVFSYDSNAQTVADTVPGATARVELPPAAPRLTAAATLRTPLPLMDAAAPVTTAPQSRRGIFFAVALVALLLAAGGAYALWPRISGVILRRQPAAPQTVAAALPPATSSVVVTPAATQPPPAVIETAAPQPEVTSSAKHAEESQRPAPSTVKEAGPPAPKERTRVRPSLYIEAPGRQPGNDRALDRLHAELRGTRQVALRAGAQQVQVYRALRRALPDLEFVPEADVVIRFDGTPDRLRRERAHLSASATIEKGGRVIFRWDLSSYIDNAAAADAFANTIADAFEE